MQRLNSKKYIAVASLATFAFLAVVAFQNCGGEFKALKDQTSAQGSNGGVDQDPLLGSRTCVHPDSSETVAAGATYISISRETGTPGECKAATVQSVCYASTGLYSPPIPALKFSKCDPGKFVHSSRGGCLLKNGALQCWGPAGYTNIQGALPPVVGATSRVVIASGVTDVSTRGQYGICAVVNGALRCWGNANGVNGLQNFESVILPSGAVQVSLGDFTVCVTTNTGGVRCHITIPNTPGNRVFASWPNIEVLTTDWLYTGCGLKVGGTIECIPSGFNPPNVVPVVKLTGVTQAENSTYYNLRVEHTCGLVGSVVKCFGRKIPMPDGTVVDSETPIDVSSNVAYFSLGLTDSSVAIPTGNRTSMCIVTTTGAVECWGWYEANRAMARTVVVPSGAYQVKVDGYMRVAVWMNDGTIKTNLGNDFAVTNTFLFQDIRLSQ